MERRAEPCGTAGAVFDCLRPVLLELHAAQRHRTKDLRENRLYALRYLDGAGCRYAGVGLGGCRGCGSCFGMTGGTDPV
jgi:hypothetical protein